MARRNYSKRKKFQKRKNYLRRKNRSALRANRMSKTRTYDISRGGIRL